MAALSRSLEQATTVKANGCLSTAKEKKMGHNRTSERKRNQKMPGLLILAVNSTDKVECLVHTILELKVKGVVTTIAFK